MATYVMSDLHGQGNLFRAMLAKIAFSRADTLYILGDVVDRGPDGIALLRQIMDAPNMHLLLGNHEHMMLRYLSPDVTEQEIRRWDRNGNVPTLEGWWRLSSMQQAKLRAYLTSLPVQRRLTVGQRDFFLVHGFPGETDFECVWGRPMPEAPNPIEGTTLIIGHTPVPYMLAEREAVPALVEDMAVRGLHPTIFHGPNFIDVDCGCSFPDPIKTLGCLRLEDMAEFYVWNGQEA